ncbi:MAG TPA: hypothetical protein VGG19_18285 [Tepidisphaeraceae bacterium]|jgi:hypothetical protein
MIYTLPDVGAALAAELIFTAAKAALTLLQTNFAYGSKKKREREIAKARKKPRSNNRSTHECK